MRATRVLVTRPVGEASQSLCALLSGAGYDTYSQPLLALSDALELTAEQAEKVRELGAYQHIIFVSTNAVRVGMPLLQECWPQLPLGMNWYAVGEATAKSLSRFDITAITPGKNMTSEGLLALPYLQNVQGQRVLIVKGEGGRDTMRTELLHRGALVDELPCYRRSPPELPAGALAAHIVQNEIDVILLSSGEGLANLLLLLSPAETNTVKDVGLIVPSDRVAVMARDAGFKHVSTAENASDEAMLLALQKWRAGNGEQ
jgi:uroporphyrinogen-III synthase